MHPRAMALALGILAFGATEAPACLSIGAYGGFTNAALEIPSTPINIGSSGQTATANVDCAIIRTEKWRVSGFAEYSWFFGDLKDIGVDTDLTLGGRVSFMASPTTQLYLAGGWSRLDTSFGNIDGWKVGPGVRFKVAGTPFDVDFRYYYGEYDVSGLVGSSIDAVRHEGRIGIVYEFPASGAIPTLNLK